MAGWTERISLEIASILRYIKHLFIHIEAFLSLLALKLNLWWKIHGFSSS